jgi:hypothetical protein
MVTLPWFHHRSATQFLLPGKSREPTAVQIVDCRQLVSGGKQFDAGGATAAADETPIRLPLEYNSSMDIWIRLKRCAANKR